MTTYKIERFYENRSVPSESIKGGLTLEEAKEHCNDDATSGIVTLGNGTTTRFFDGFTEE